MAVPGKQETGVLLMKLLTESGPLVVKVWKPRDMGYMELRGPAYPELYELPSQVAALFSQLEGKKVASLMAGEVTALRAGEAGYDWLLACFEAE